jgi:hypothetical protein
MVRTQVQLTAAQARELKALAAERNQSMAEIVRVAVEGLLAASRGVSREERHRRAIAAIGSFASGQSDVSREHDRYLAEAYRT